MSRESYFHPLTVPGTDTVVSLLITIFSLYPLSAALGDYIIESDERYQHLTPMRILEGLPLRYLTQELRSILVSARIQKIVMTERRETWLQTYSSKGNGYFVISAHPHLCCLFFTREKPSTPKIRESGWEQILNKYLAGGTIESINPVEWDRVVCITVKNHRLWGSENTFSLYAELTGRNANLILTTTEKNPIILGSFRQVSDKQSRFRIIAPGMRYLLPPPKLDAWDPLEYLSPHFHTEQKPPQEEVTLVRWCIRHLQGVGPFLAREMVDDLFPNPPVTISQIQKALRKLTDPLTPGAGPVSVFLSPETGEPQGIFWKPSLRYESADRRDFPSFAPAMEFYARTFWESRKEQNAREQCRKFLEKELNFIHQEIQTIESLLTSDDEMAHLRSAGELLKLFSQLPVIAKRPDGAEVTNILSPNAEPFFIELDPRLTINQNMQRFFRLYRKAQTRNTLFSQKRKSLEAKKREYLHELDHLTHFPKEEIMPEESSLPSPPSPFAPSGIRKFITPSRNEILVGKNDRANHQLVTRLAARNDYWLHVRDFPGSHVLLRITHSPESREEDLFRAARIAAYFSSARNETRVGVILTEVKHLRVIPGTGPGKVTFQHEKTLTISPAIPEDVKKIT